MQKFDIKNSWLSIAWLVLACFALFIAHQYTENGRYKVQGPLVLDTRTGDGKTISTVVASQGKVQSFDWNRFPDVTSQNGGKSFEPDAYLAK